MSLSEEAHEQIDAFLEYVEDLSKSDDRYGTAARCTGLDESSLATRFEVEPSCWLEVGVQPEVPQIYVALVTQSASASKEIVEAIRECEEPLSGVVEGAFEAAGLTWADPPVDHESVDGESFHCATPLEIEDLDDLDRPELRSKAVRMLEGYFIAFGSALMPHDVGDDEDEDGEGGASTCCNKGRCG